MYRESEITFPTPSLNVITQQIIVTLSKYGHIALSSLRNVYSAKYVVFRRGKENCTKNVDGTIQIL